MQPLLVGALRQNRRALATQSDALLGLGSVSKGDVVLCAAEADLVSTASAQGLRAVCIAEAGPGFAEASATLKGLGATAVVTSEYAGTWRMKRLLSDLPQPKLGICAGDRYVMGRACRSMSGYVCGCTPTRSNSSLYMHATL